MPTRGSLRHIILLFTICCAGAAVLRAQQKPDDVLRVNTDLVQTDFMVFDKQGNFVDGLKRDQFVLKVEGKPRDISFFDRIAAGSRNEESQLAAARGAGLNGGPAPVPLDRGRTVLFFIDDLHLSSGSVTYTRQMLKRFIDHDLKQNDEAEIVSTSGQLGFLQQLTDNKSVLTSAAERLHALNPMLQTGEYPPMTEYQATLIERNDDQLLNFFVDELIKHEGNLPRPQAVEMIRARAAPLVEEGANLVTRSLSTLRGFINLAAVLPGRKIVFFVSDGFLLEERRSDNYDRLQRITQAAAKSGVVIYALDSRGLGAGLPDASQQVLADSSGTLTRVNGGELRATQDGMNALASDTGGRAFFNTNSMPTALVTALKESSTYYLLAWRPETDEQRNPKFRRLEVGILGRPDLVVRFRRGFGEQPEETSRNKDKDKARETLPVRKTPVEEINAALTAQYPMRAMPVAIALNYIDTAQYGGTLTTTIKVGTSALSLDPQDTQAGAGALLDVAGLVLNDQGKSVSSFSKRFTIKASAVNANKKPPESIFYNHFALIKPGLYQVRVAAVDVKTGTRGSAYQWIEVPDVANKELTMSSLIVGERKTETAEGQPLEAASNDPHQPEPFKQVTVNVDHRFTSSSYLRFLTFIYNAAPGAIDSGNGKPANTVQPITLPNKDGGTPAARDNPIPAGTGPATPATAPDLAVQVQVFRDNEPVITAPLHKIEAEKTFDALRVPYAADVPLNGLQPGAYILQVTVIDRLAKASASRKLSFYIE
jgi:VWFA-related protein